jgi:hypothetical protein
MKRIEFGALVFASSRHHLFLPLNNGSHNFYSVEKTGAEEEKKMICSSFLDFHESDDEIRGWN